MAMQDEIFLQAATPAYIFDLDALKERIGMMRSCLGNDIRLVYAVKANPFLVRALTDMVDAFEICSPGEEAICRRAGVPGEKMLLSGVNKEREDFSQIMDRYGDLPVYTAESEYQARMLNELAVEKGLVLRVLLRLCGGSQFGMDETVLRRIVSEREQYPGLMLTGVHFFTGTQKRPKVIAREIARMDAFMCSLSREVQEYGGAEEERILQDLEYGPGLSVRYFTSDTPPDDPAALKDLCLQLEQMKFGGRVTLEMGRFIAAYCGYYLTRIEDMKLNEGTGYCIVDGGIHQMTYYGSAMGMKIPFIKHLRSGSVCGQDGAGGDTACGRQGSGGDTAWTVCGSLCTINDVLVRELPLTDPGIHDILVFERTGAYSMTEGISLFLSRDLPRIYLWEGGSLKLIREKIMTEELNYGTAD